MEQIERIRRMEEILDEAEEALEALDRALDRYEALRDKLAELEAYYCGGLWMRDSDDDAAGKLPPDLKRGVLSEDAVYDLLSDHDRILARFRELGDEPSEK